jgi:anhydro-N-acetylmuramic acid kinase
MPRAIGLMSGTSLDGVDAAWVETDGHGIQAFGPTLTIPYDDTLRRDLRAILDAAPGLAPNDAGLRDAERRLTAVHAQAVKAVGRTADLIGFHGQTILHQPDRQRTWQIGDAAMLAAQTGLPVAFDFRSADVAAGGQGAPFAPAYHAALARELPKPLAVLNIGGVANVTWIGEDGAMLAFDTGPGNGPLDDWAERHTGQRFDRDGALALSGRVDTTVLQQLLAHPYFAQVPPKSLDRLDFAASLAASGVNALSPSDGAATLAAFTVQAIVRAPLPAAPQRWLVCGGGRQNPVLMDGLRHAFGVPVDAVDTLGWDGNALEAQCFGFLAARVLAGLPLSFPGTTGVPAPMAGGRIAHP